MPVWFVYNQVPYMRVFLLRPVVDVPSTVYHTLTGLLLACATGVQLNLRFSPDLTSLLSQHVYQPETSRKAEAEFALGLNQATATACLHQLCEGGAAFVQLLSESCRAWACVLLQAS